MPRFHTNPGNLTKDRLKSELTSQGVILPKTDQRKQVYIDLYLEHLTSQNDEDVRLFSSDEEQEEEDTKRKPAPSRTKHLIRKPVKGLPFDVNALSDGDLARQLRNYGQVVGPITDTTRPLYQKKLIKILQEEMKNPDTFHEQLKPPLQQSKPWEFSENEEEEEEEEEEEAKPVSSKRKQKQKPQEEIVMIEDHIDAVAEAPQDMTPPKQSPPNVTKQETIVSESYIETRKRVVANNKSVDSAIKSQRLPQPIKPSAVKQADGNSWEWKAVLVVLAIITSILLVYYFMEGSPNKPRLNQRV